MVLGWLGSVSTNVFGYHLQGKWEENSWIVHCRRLWCTQDKNNEPLIWHTSVENLILYSVYLIHHKSISSCFKISHTHCLLSVLHLHWHDFSGVLSLLILRTSGVPPTPAEHPEPRPCCCQTFSESKNLILWLSSQWFSQGSPRFDACLSALRQVCQQNMENWASVFLLWRVYLKLRVSSKDGSLEGKQLKWLVK